MPRPEHVDLARLLLRKARGDLAVARLIAVDPDPHDDAIGFHAQQAVEKAIKAVLAFSRAPAPRTHDLAYLVELLATHGIEVPATIAEPEWLSPWAVTTRYDDLDDTLDRHAAIDAAKARSTGHKRAYSKSPATTAECGRGIPVSGRRRASASSSSGSRAASLASRSRGAVGLALWQRPALGPLRRRGNTRAGRRAGLRE